jgi:hypothetical protein
MSDVHPDDEARAFDRRSFVKKAAVGAFAIPAIVSFKLDSLARASGYHSYPNQTLPDQSFPNQTYPNQTPPFFGFFERLFRLLQLLFRR